MKRLSDPEYAKKLLDQLDELAGLVPEVRDIRHRYRRFMRAALVAFAVLIAANLWFLFVALPHKTDQIQQSRSAALKQVCEDQKTLLRLVPHGYAPLERARRADPMSSLNPDRDCDEFARRAIAR